MLTKRKISAIEHKIHLGKQRCNAGEMSKAELANLRSECLTKEKVLRGRIRHLDKIRLGRERKQKEAEDRKVERWEEKQARKEKKKAEKEEKKAEKEIEKEKGKEAGEEEEKGADEKKINKKTKAILPVHLYGYPAEMDQLTEISDRHGIKVIEDACQAHGAMYNGRRVGLLGDAACFSFYPSKNMTVCGDGGMTVTNDKKVAEKIKKIDGDDWTDIMFTMTILGENLWEETP